MQRRLHERVDYGHELRGAYDGGRRGVRRMTRAPLAPAGRRGEGIGEREERRREGDTEGGEYGPNLGEIGTAAADVLECFRECGRVVIFVGSVFRKEGEKASENRLQRGLADPSNQLGTIGILVIVSRVEVRVSGCEFFELFQVGLGDICQVAETKQKLANIDALEGTVEG